MTEALDQLRAKLAAVEAKLPASAPSDALAQSFHLGRVGFRPMTARQQRRADAATDRSVDEAKQRVALCRERDLLRARIADVESGAAAGREARRQAQLERLQAAKVGDVVIDSAFGVCTVARVNRKGLTIDTGTYREARPWDLLVDAARVSR